MEKILRLKGFKTIVSTLIALNFASLVPVSRTTYAMSKPSYFEELLCDVFFVLQYTTNEFSREIEAGPIFLTSYPDGNIEIKTNLGSVPRSFVLQANSGSEEWQRLAAQVAQEIQQALESSESGQTGVKRQIRVPWQRFFRENKNKALALSLRAQCDQLEKSLVPKFDSSLQVQIFAESYTWSRNR